MDIDISAFWHWCWFSIAVQCTHTHTHTRTLTHRDTYRHTHVHKVHWRTYLGSRTSTLRNNNNCQTSVIMANTWVDHKQHQSCIICWLPPPSNWMITIKVNVCEWELAFSLFVPGMPRFDRYQRENNTNTHQQTKPVYIRSLDANKQKKTLQTKANQWTMKMIWHDNPTHKKNQWENNSGKFGKMVTRT